MLELIQAIAYLPTGIIISMLTVRLASRNIASKILPHAWNTLVTLTVSYYVWCHLILYRGSHFSKFGHGFPLDCDLAALSYWVPPDRNIDMNTDGASQDKILSTCDSSETIKLMCLVGLRCLIFVMGAKLGAALQPVGLTGGIACGKSTVSRLLKDPSMKHKKDAFAIVDVDAIAHDILVPGKMGPDCGYNRVVQAFSGDDIFSGSGEKGSTIDRRKLGDIIFRDRSKRRILNGITHPLISKIMMKQIVCESIKPSSQHTSTVSVDIPLLFEVGLQMKLLFGIKIVVACDENIQLKRLMARNNDLTREQCESRIKSQIPIGKKVNMADIVIWNNGTVDDLALQVEVARKKVMNRSVAFLGITLPACIVLACVLTISSCLFESFNV